MVIPTAFSSSLAVRSAVGVVLAAAIAARAFRRRSLNASGGIAGFVVMAVHIACGYRYGALLLAFFLSSSKLTKIGEDRKRRVEDEFKEGGQRNWIQVLANSTIATILVVIFEIMTGGQDQCLDSNGSKIITGIIGGIIGHYCCCNGDTWSSEIGVLSNEQPRLITTLKMDYLYMRVVPLIILGNGGRKKEKGANFLSGLHLLNNREACQEGYKWWSDLTRTSCCHRRRPDHRSHFRYCWIVDS
ncbi:unnamed protein product [Urochloa decumbens]|uniref:Protein PGR n=1 Tax=Urochloa decumbens TaxID=240449 RepID=A0ABC9GIY9_9POAL